jgi:thiamine kinase-like enzyme
MILTEHNIFYYLLDIGMIDVKSIIDGEFTARRSDSRNNNFIINREFAHHTYFIKQVKAPDAEKIETLRAEAACYQLANSNEHYKPLKNFLPQFFHYDPLNHVLITAQVKEAATVYEYYFRMHEFNNKIPEIIADTLASYHNTVAKSLQQQAGLQQFKQQKPWVFTVAAMPPDYWMQNEQAAEQQTIQLIQKNREFMQLLSQVENEWQPQTLVHNDAKFSNFLISYKQDDNTINFIKLIDWELADIGDPLWDVATIFQNYLSLWVNTDVPGEVAQPGFRKISLPEVQRPIQVFWKRYGQQMKWQPHQAEAMLIKATRFCALKLIHACFETAPYQKSLQPISVKMLQMSFNILRSPKDAATKLLGIPVNMYKNEGQYQHA